MSHFQNQCQLNNNKATHRKGHLEESLYSSYGSSVSPSLIYGQTEQKFMHFKSYMIDDDVRINIPGCFACKGAVPEL